MAKTAMQRAQERITDESPVEILSPPTSGKTVRAPSRPTNQLVLDRTYKRDSRGRFGSGAGVRDALAGAGSIDELNGAAAAEMKRITGRDIPIDMAGADLQMAKEHLEGIMQGLDRFPDASLTGVYSYGPGAAKTSMGTEIARLHGDASAVTQAHGVMEGGRYVTKSAVYFNTKYAGDPAGYRADKEADRAGGYLVTGSPTGTGLHEFGHVITNQTSAKRSAYDSAVEMADAAGAAPSYYVTRHVSAYAASDMGEFAAEAFADVMHNGAGASDVSRAAFDVLDAAYQSSTSRSNAALVVRPRSRFFGLLAAARNRTYKRDADGRFGSGGDGGARGIRDAFAQAKTITSLELAAEGELGSILGQRVAVKLAGLEMDAARAHVEGIARSAELYPRTDLISVTSYGPRGQVSDIPGQQPGVHDTVWGVTSSVVGRPGADIYLNTRIDAPKMRRVTTKAVAEGVVDGDMSDITWTGSHEMGHAAASMMRRGDPQQGAVRIATETAGGSVEHVYNELRTTVSRYALTPGGDELIGEATAQVASLGSAASPISKAVVKGLQDSWDEWSISSSPKNRAGYFELLATARNRAYTRDSDGKFASGGGGSPDAMHEEGRIRAAYSFTDSATGYRTEVERISRPGDPNPDINEWIRHPTVPAGRTMVTVGVFDADGNRVGEACRTVHPGSQARVNHNFLVLNEGQRGQGFATRFNAHAEEVYRANGVKMITLHADLDVGGYAWARGGYDFRNSQTRSSTASRAYVESVKRGHPRHVIDQFGELARGGKATPLELAMVGHASGATTWPGKEIMLESDWQGVKVL